MSVEDGLDGIRFDCRIVDVVVAAAGALLRTFRETRPPLYSSLHTSPPLRIPQAMTVMPLETVALIVFSSSPGVPSPDFSSSHTAV